MYRVLRPFSALWDISGHGTVAFDLCDLHLWSTSLPWEVIKSVVLSKGLLEEFEKSKIIANGDTWLSWYCMAARLQSLCCTWCCYFSVSWVVSLAFDMRLKRFEIEPSGILRALILAKMVLIVGASWFMAQIVPFFADFVNLLGATLTPLIAFIVPLLLYGLCISMNDAQLQQEPMW